MTDPIPYIRPILKQDNAQIEQVIRAVFDEINIPKTGTAYEDPALKNLYQAYQLPRSIYFVIVKNNKIFGGAGIAPLAAVKDNICELQKMYFSPLVRGLGLGQQLIKLCLTYAKQFNFDQCYLETMPYMQAAQHLYKKNGFVLRNGALGCTGHTACPVHMITNLK